MSSERGSRSILKAACPVVGLWLVLLAAGCTEEQVPTGFVARVGDAYLNPEAVDEALTTMPPYQDSVSAREQIIDRWVTDQLLVQEARRRNLGDNPEVIRRLEENEQSVLISALLGQMYELTQEPSATDVKTYFDRNQDRLRLREAYVRVRYMVTADSASAVRGRRVLVDARSQSNIDSTWAAAIEAFASDPEGALALSTNFYPMSRVFAVQPQLRRIVLDLNEGEVAPVVASNGAFHVIQLAERIQEGTLPELGWVSPEIRQRLLIQSRKQLYADQVERLRNEALAREALETRGQ